MHTVIPYSPGQVATINIATYANTDGYGGGLLADGYATPQITAIYFPNNSSATGFPANMTRIAKGLWQYKFTLPSGTSSVGSYVVLVTSFDPLTALPINEIVELVVNAPFGNFSVTPA